MALSHYLCLLTAIFYLHHMESYSFHRAMARFDRFIDAVDEDLVWKTVHVQLANQNFQILQGKNFDKFIADSIRVNESYDPFGVITWPSSEVAASILSMIHSSPEKRLAGRIVVDLGCGTGLSTLMALSLGATVIAIDNNPITLDLVRATVGKNFGQQGLERLETREFSIFSDDNLPQCDYLILSDMLYSTALATRCAERAYESICFGARVLITDPDRSTSKCFTDTLNELIADKSRLLSYDLSGMPSEVERITFRRFNVSNSNTESRIPVSTRVNYLWLERKQEW